MIDTLKLFPKIFSMEIKKIFAYRTNFWIRLIGALGLEMIIAFYLWNSIFLQSKQETFAGYSFKGMMFYYVMSLMLARINGSWRWGDVSQEIYDGALNRYLLYPVDFFTYKFLQAIPEWFISILQCTLIISIFILVWGIPENVHIHFINVLHFIIYSLLGNLLFFSMGMCFELVSFWADNVWSLMVLLRFAISLLGGLMLPLSLFPEHIRNVLDWLPFSQLISYPVRLFQGELNSQQILFGYLNISFWIIIFGALAFRIWKIGNKKYTGVGI